MPKWAQAIGGSIIAILFAGNVFFVARLVEQLDATREQVWALRQDVVVLTARMDGLRKCNYSQPKGRMKNEGSL
jgi:hypothetical protein